ncbi:L-fucose/L-arabinose isomerase family protein [Candidatus Latescibacterota bacterium]
MIKETTLAVIFGNRDFFPDHLVTEARSDIIRLFGDLGIKSIIPDEHATKLGGVETYAEAKICSDLLKKHSEIIDGILVVLPNFGDEKGVLDAVRTASLNVPLLIQGYPDDPQRMDVARRRDAYCGKISVCNNLYQAGIPYSLTRKHVIHPDDPMFREDLQKFASVCRVTGGLRGARIGAIGARPGAFNTVRYSEKILEANGISVTTADLSEILGDFERLNGSDPQVKRKIEEIASYADTGDVAFIEENELDATAIQCWTSMQKNFGINVCTSMSMMSENLLPSACEVDVTGVLTMYAMQLASGTPSALADWNNNYGLDEDKLVMFHCGNWCKSFLPGCKISTAPILGTTVGEENTYGALEGRTPAGPLTYCRISTDDIYGEMKSYIGEGELTDDSLDTFGAKAVAHIPGLDTLMQYVCENGFEHHVALNMSHTAGVLKEAFGKYLGWDVYVHESPGPV